jgi:Flp pilus assembly protein TadD
MTPPPHAVYAPVVTFRAILLVALGIVSAAMIAAAPALAQSPRTVLLVVNAASPESERIGEHYARRRGLPNDAILRLRTSVADEIPRAEYLAHIEAPLTAWFGRNSAHDRVHFIVLTKGVPLRVAGSGGRNGTLASVDSELALLYRRMTGRQVPVQGFVPNPYYAGETPPGRWKPFTHEQHDIFLVTRLDGYTAEDAIGLVDRALGASEGAAGRAGAPVPSADAAPGVDRARARAGEPAEAAPGAGAAEAGRIVLDMKAALEDRGNAWLKAAADRLQAMGLGDRVVLEQTSTVVRDQKDLLGYYSWGSNDPAIRDRDLGNRFVPGAVAGQFVSSDARTFKEPPAEWKLGTWQQTDTYYAGAPQSLTGDLVRQGITGVAGYVAEPFLDGTVRPDILFPAYLAGYTLGEAFYLAMPYLSWQAVVVGDPLARVAGREKPLAETLDPGLDPVTELPVWFSKRRLEALTTPTAKTEAIAALTRAEARRTRGDEAGARKALEEAATIEPKLTMAHLLLGTMHDAAGEYEQAEARYRAALANEPRNVIALNNLAYLLAVRQKRPADALPFAERAHTLVPGNGNIADTLAWVHHLAGNPAQAGRYIADALRAEPGNAEVRLHAAAILLEAGDLEGAKREYAKAVELDAAIAEREEAKAVAGRLR